MPVSASTISGAARCSSSIAWSPSATATIRTSSSANVSSTTRWIVGLSSARRIVGGTLKLPDFFRPRPGVGANEVDDVLHRRAGQEDPFDAHRLQVGNVHVGNDPPDHDQHIVEALLLH